MHKTLIRQVDPHLLQSPAGWNTALRPDRTNPVPRWQRGDIATVTELSTGWLVACADTWCANNAGLYLGRNSLVFVDRQGVVSWISSAGQGFPGGVPIPAEPGRWFWPKGGWAVGSDGLNAESVLIFGGHWDLPAAGAPYGDRIGWQVASIDGLDSTPTDPVVVNVDLPVDIDWGPPVRHGGMVYTAGYQLLGPGEWAHYIASHSASLTAAFYASGWTVTPIQVTQGPLTPMRLLRWRDGWLASAFILPSGPELSFNGTPEIACWYSPTIMGPFERIQNARDDTTRAGWRCYAGGVVDLGFGPWVEWSRNAAPALTPAWSVDGYGPVFAPADLPDWSVVPG